MFQGDLPPSMTYSVTEYSHTLADNSVKLWLKLNVETVFYAQHLVVNLRFYQRGIMQVLVEESESSLRHFRASEHTVQYDQLSPIQDMTLTKVEDQLLILDSTSEEEPYEYLVNLTHFCVEIRVNNETLLIVNPNAQGLFYSNTAYFHGPQTLHETSDFSALDSLLSAHESFTTVKPTTF